MCDAGQWDEKECFLVRFVHWDRGVMVHDYSPLLVASFVIDDFLDDDSTNEYVVYVRNTECSGVVSGEIGDENRWGKVRCDKT